MSIDGMVAWVRQQLDHDEQAADVATPGTWTVRKPASVETDCVTDDNRGHVVYSVGMYNRGWPSDEDAVHIALHDPGDVRADVEAKRLILAAYEASVAADSGTVSGSGRPLFSPATFAYRRAVECVAYGYRLRDGYQDEWKPS